MNNHKNAITEKDRQELLDVMGIDFKNLSRAQESLILYVEDCCVNSTGYLDSRKMNHEDFQILAIFKVVGLLDYQEYDDFGYHPDDWSGAVLSSKGKYDVRVQPSDKLLELAYECRKKRATLQLSYKPFSYSAFASDEVTKEA